uniref:Uncharacterized protein n=1 Tax=Biomphalaria glabrata TaxID=6526 RepID=A0A2C9KT27_BIOGL
MLETVELAYESPGVKYSPRVDNFASWGQWSDWFIIGATSKIRIRSCLVDGGRETSEVACDGVRVQLKSCESGHGDRCGKVQNISTNSDGNCVQTSRPKTREGVVKPPPPQPPPAPQTPPTEKPDPGVCHYSLFDNYRQKYVISRWNLTELMMKSKVKRWCDRKTGQYTIMTSPEDHCRRYYKDLCKAMETRFKIRFQSESVLDAEPNSSPKYHDKSAKGGTEHAINITGDEKNVVIDKRENNINTNNVVVDHTFIDSDISDDVNGVDEVDEDAIYDLPPATPVTSNQILSMCQAVDIAGMCQAVDIAGMCQAVDIGSLFDQLLCAEFNVDNMPENSAAAFAVID